MAWPSFGLLVSRSQGPGRPPMLGLAFWTKYTVISGLDKYERVKGAPGSIPGCEFLVNFSQPVLLQKGQSLWPADHYLLSEQKFSRSSVRIRQVRLFYTGVFVTPPPNY